MKEKIGKNPGVKYPGVSNPGLNNPEVNISWGELLTSVKKLMG